MIAADYDYMTAACLGNPVKESVIKGLCAIAGSGAYFYLKYTIPTYIVNATILVEEQASSPGVSL